MQVPTWLESAAEVAIYEPVNVETSVVLCKTRQTRNMNGYDDVGGKIFNTRITFTISIDRGKNFFLTRMTLSKRRN